MTCKNCGQKLPDDSRFCDFCGEPQESGDCAEETKITVGEVSVNAPGTMPMGTPGEASVPPTDGLVWTETGLGYPGGEVVIPRKKPPKRLFAVAGGVLALLILLAVLLWFALHDSGDPKTVALDAIAQTRSQLADERAQRQKILGAGTAFEGLRERAVKQELELRVQALCDGYGRDMGALSGAGVRFELRQDFPNRRMALDSRFGVGASDIFRVLLQFQDDEAAVNFPQADPNWYGFHTRTWAKDYSRSIFAGLGLELFSGDEGFNVFDPPEDGQGKPLPFYDSEKVASLGTALKGEIIARNMGSKETDVNGDSLGCERYELIIPQNAIRTYVHGVCRSVRDSEDFQAGWRQYVNSFWRQNLYRFDNYDEAEQAFSDQVDQWIDELGNFFVSDVTMDVYTRGGRAVKLELTGTGEEDGSEKDYRARLEAGTKTGALSDAFRFRFEILGGGALEFTARGNSIPKNGAYTCDAKLTLEEGGGEIGALTASCEYDPRGGDDNFHFKTGLLAPDQSEPLSLSADGSVHTGQKACSFSAKLDRIRLAMADSFDLTLSGSYSIGSLDTQKEPIETVPTVSLFGMTKSEFYTLLQKLTAVFQNAIPEQL